MFGMMSASSWWLVVGAAFMALEAFGIPGAGFLFAGLAAIIVGALTLSDIIGQDALVQQTSIWFGMTVVFGFILWKPLKRWRMNPSGKDQFSNMVGDTATVTDGALKTGFPGKAKWSGTTMVAELAPGVDELPEGALAEIADVRGTVLILKPRSSSTPHS